jgi:hypothetical protein
MVPFLADGGVATQVGPYASAVSAIVALLALIFSVLAFRAAARRKNAALAWVGAAFLVFAVKNAFTSAVVVSHFVPHDEIELVLSALDLAIMLLLFAPFLTRRKA